MLLRLCAKFGNGTSFEEHKFYAFPSPEKLAKSDFHKLEECGLGYRARYVCETAKMVNENGFNFESLRKLPYAEAITALVKENKVPLYSYTSPGVELGYTCGKSFPVSSLPGCQLL
jgi:3-methyladenine DNA glycosylase/8-oxoguanine DNA glycosylase